MSDQDGELAEVRDWITQLANEMPRKLLFDVVETITRNVEGGWRAEGNRLLRADGRREV